MRLRLKVDEIQGGNTFGIAKHFDPRAGTPLENLPPRAVAAAVKTFIQQKVSQLAQAKRYTPDIQNMVLQHLMLNSNDTFLWVALVCQDLEATPMMASSVSE